MPPMMPPSHWMPPVMGGPFGRHAAMWLFHFIIQILYYYYHTKDYVGMSFKGTSGILETYLVGVTERIIF